MDQSPSFHQSTRKMLDVRQQRRRRLCQALTLIGSAFLLAFGTLSLLDGAYGLGAVLLASMAAGLGNAYLLYRRGNVERAVLVLNGILFILCLTLLITGGKENTGILWIYPIVAINLFINRFWNAVYLYGTFLVISGLLLFTPLSSLLQAHFAQVEAVRFELTLFALWAICLTALRSEERAYELVLQLHDDDVHRLAFYDPLTNLPNRRLLLDRLGRCLSSARRHHHTGALLFLDLDRFKTINDSLGHGVGDRLLSAVAARLEGCLREEDSAARLGGDEFIVLIPELATAADEAQTQAAHLVARLQQQFYDPFLIDGMELFVTASIGVSLFPRDDARDGADVLRQADIAMYRAKENGRNDHRFYTHEMQEHARRKQRLEKALHQALVREEFTLVYQPQVDARGAILGFEALLRWHHPTLGEVSPHRFIPVAEESGLILPIGRWVLRAGCRQLAEWQAAGLDARLAVNISPRQFAGKRFVEEVEGILDETGARAAGLELELTEGMLVEHIDAVTGKMAALKQRGVRFAIDDFGTGYSSLRYLKHLPLDQLKIDQSFVRDLGSDLNSSAIVHTIIAVGRHLGLSLIAEGVETVEQKQTLVALECAHFQGFYFSRPLDREAATGYLAAGTSMPATQARGPSVAAG